MKSSKRGLGWPYDNPEGAFNFYRAAINKNGLTWLFNWEMWKPKGVPAELNFVPQVRTGYEAAQIDQYMSTLGENVDHFIGFNEPDNIGQANLPVAQAVQLWKQYVLPAKAKFDFRLGSPAMTNSPAGKKWLREFLGSLDGDAKVDFIVLHWYGLNAQELGDYLEDMHKTFNKPIWLNEFACTTFGGNTPSEEEVKGFQQEALKLLDGKDYVERYAWFGAATNKRSMGGVAPANELAEGDKLTAVGKTYCEM